jgi:hypothetical protein
MAYFFGQKIFQDMKASQGSLKALDWANLFMADVKDGVGVYLSVFLLSRIRLDTSLQFQV